MPLTLHVPFAMVSFVEVGYYFLVWWVLLPLAVLLALGLAVLLLLAIPVWMFCWLKKRLDRAPSVESQK
jgi:hypothetical protein